MCPSPFAAALQRTWADGGACVTMGALWRSLLAGARTCDPALLPLVAGGGGAGNVLVLRIRLQQDLDEKKEGRFIPANAWAFKIQGCRGTQLKPGVAAAFAARCSTSERFLGCFLLL